MNTDNIYALLRKLSHYLLLCRSQCFKPNHDQINKIHIGHLGLLLLIAHPLEI